MRFLGCAGGKLLPVYFGLLILADELDYGRRIIESMRVMSPGCPLDDLDFSAGCLQTLGKEFTIACRSDDQVVGAVNQQDGNRQHFCKKIDRHAGVRFKMFEIIQAVVFFDLIQKTEILETAYRCIDIDCRNSFRIEGSVSHRIQASEAETDQCRFFSQPQGPQKIMVSVEGFLIFIISTSFGLQVDVVETLSQQSRHAGAGDKGSWPFHAPGPGHVGGR